MVDARKDGSGDGDVEEIEHLNPMTATAAEAGTAAGASQSILTKTFYSIESLNQLSATDNMPQPSQTFLSANRTVPIKCASCCMINSGSNAASNLLLTSVARKRRKKKLHYTVRRAPGKISHLLTSNRLNSYTDVATVQLKAHPDSSITMTTSKMSPVSLPSHHPNKSSTIHDINIFIDDENVDDDDDDEGDGDDENEDCATSTNATTMTTVTSSQQYRHTKDSAKSPSSCKQHGHGQYLSATNHYHHHHIERSSSTRSAATTSSQNISDFEEIDGSSGGGGGTDVKVTSKTGKLPPSATGDDCSSHNNRELRQRFPTHVV